MTPLDFLNRLWQYKPEEQYLLIWTWPDKLSRWFTKVPEAAAYVSSINGGRDVYMGVGLAGKDYGPSHRCASDEITAIAAISADFDIASEAHPDKPLPATIEQAIALAPELLPPSLVISTGNGAHCWWILREPHVFESEQDRKDVARLLYRWHTMLKFAAGNHGWVYERLADLARILRIPGTRNLKDPQHPKDVTAYREIDRQYNLGDFEEFLDAAGIPDQDAQERAAKEWAARFADKTLVINPSARIAQELIDLWMKDNMRFRNTWLRQRHDLKDQSNSAYDMALAWFAAQMDLPEQMAVDLIMHHRAVLGKPARTRLDYYQRTISAAYDKAAEAKAGEAKPSTAQVGGPRDSGPQAGAAQSGAPVMSEAAAMITDPIQRRGQLCQEISEKLGVTIVKLTKITGENPHYLVHTEKGVLEFASPLQIRSYETWCNKLYGQLDHVIDPPIKAKEWLKLSKKIALACEIQECAPNETFEGKCTAWLKEYLADQPFIAQIEGTPVQNQKLPMVYEGRIVVHTDAYSAWLTKHHHGDYSSNKAATMLKVLGAEVTKKFRNSRYNRQMRWVLPLPAFDPETLRSVDAPAPKPEEEEQSE